MNLHMENRHLKIVLHILKKYPYKFFAFGSRVSGKNHKGSDLDLFYTEAIPLKQILNLEEDFEESDLPFKVDIVDYKKCEPSFQIFIAKNFVEMKS